MGDAPRFTNPDAALMARVARGDDDAAAAIVRAHQAVMVRFVARMLGPQDPAVDDVVQLAFIAALSAPGRFHGRSTVRSWLIGIAHNQARMHLRARGRRRRMQEVWRAAASLWSDRAPPEVERREIGDRIDGALDALDPDRRAVFLLADVEGHTAGEVAEMLGAPEGTVRRWRVEARAALRPQLADLDAKARASGEAR